MATSPKPEHPQKDTDLDSFARMIETRLAKAGVSASACQQSDVATAQRALDASLAIMLALDTRSVLRAADETLDRVWFQPNL